jgi:RimJ/RimL family protein N-acetyltransferase
MHLGIEPRRAAATRHTSRLILREFRSSDVDALFEIQGDREYMRFTYASPSREACAAWLQQYVDAAPQTGFAPWTVLHRGEQRIIGWGGLSIDPTAPQWGPEVSYFIHRDYQGAGFATELVMAALTYGLAELELPHIAAFTRPENAASIRVLLKCGFEWIRYEPTLDRNHYGVQRTT